MICTCGIVINTYNSYSKGVTKILCSCGSVYYWNDKSKSYELGETTYNRVNRVVTAMLDTYKGVSISENEYVNLTYNTMKQLVDIIGNIDRRKE